MFTRYYHVYTSEGLYIIRMKHRINNKKTSIFSWIYKIQYLRGHHSNQKNFYNNYKSKIQETE